MNLKLLDKPSTGIPGTDEIASLDMQVAERATAFIDQMKRRINEVRAHGEKARAEALADVSGATHPSVRAHAERLAEKRTSEYRKKVLAETEAQRTAQLRELNTAVDRLGLVQRLYPSPVQFLSSHGLGSEERTRYGEQIAQAGPAELVTVANLALAKNDRALGAAVLGKLDSLPTKDRPFTAGEFAGRMVGKQHETLMNTIRKARLHLQNCLAANQELERGRGDSLSRISRGLKARQLED